MTEELKKSTEEEASTTEQAPSEENKQGEKSESKDLQAEIKKLKEERDNYKEGMLSSKKKLKEVTSEAEGDSSISKADLAETVKSLVREETKEVLTENDELKESLKSKATTANDNLGTNLERTEEKPKAKLSEEDRKTLEGFGVDSNKYAEDNPEVGRTD